MNEKDCGSVGVEEKRSEKGSKDRKAKGREGLSCKSRWEGLFVNMLIYWVKKHSYEYFKCLEFILCSNEELNYTYIIEETRMWLQVWIN